MVHQNWDINRFNKIPLILRQNHVQKQPSRLSFHYTKPRKGSSSKDDQKSRQDSPGTRENPKPQMAGRNPAFSHRGELSIYNI